MLFELSEKTYKAMKKDLIFWVEAVDAWKSYGIELKNEELKELANLASVLNQKIKNHIIKEDY